MYHTFKYEIVRLYIIKVVLFLYVALLMPQLIKNYQYQYSGYLGAAPSLLWASGAMFIALAPLLVPVAIWIYTLVFAFASLWFAHYALAALERLRQATPVEVLDPLPNPAAPSTAGPVALPPATDVS